MDEFVMLLMGVVLLVVGFAFGFKSRNSNDQRFMGRILVVIGFILIILNFFDLLD